MPLQYLIALFIALPIVELALLIKLHGMVGLLPTILLVFLTGVAGASLVRHQGLNILFSIRREMDAGRLPAPQMMDGVMILIAGALLVTPGLITDAAGFSLLVPYVRAQIRLWLRKKMEDKMRSGYVQVNVHRNT
jgi:UPF0716 protein FxsA